MHSIHIIIGPYSIFISNVIYNIMNFGKLEQSFLLLNVNINVAYKNHIHLLFFWNVDLPFAN